MTITRHVAQADDKTEAFPEFDQEITQKILNLGLHDCVYYPDIQKRTS